MVARAKENARLAGVANITFIESSAEKLPFPDASFDVVISNGVFNLVVDKYTALKEVWRVLKPGGRFMLADQVLVGKLPKRPELGWQAGLGEKVAPYRERISWLF